MEGGQLVEGLGEVAPSVVARALLDRQRFYVPLDGATEVAPRGADVREIAEHLGRVGALRAAADVEGTRGRKPP